MKSPFSKRITFVHTGHIGDIIAFLPVFNAMGGTDLVIRDESWMIPMSGYKYDSLKPLLESQGIQVSFNNPASSIDHDVSGWRECYEHTLSLTDAQARYMNVVPRGTGHLEITKPWLKVEADPLTKGRVIFNRTPRYRSPDFNWSKVHKHFGDRALFIGAEQEHLDYLCEVGNIEYYKTENCLDVARAIEGADFFVGNQSSACWIAMGLRKPLLQETCFVPNSIIRYEGAHYTINCDADLSVL
jgi:hypothetical protein